MKMLQCSLALFALIPGVPVLAIASSLEFSPVTMSVHDSIAVADFFEPEDRKVVQKDIMAAAEQTMAKDDMVLHIGWQQLFRLGSLVFDDIVAWQTLAAVDLKKHVALMNSGERDPSAETELSTAVHECSTSELILEKQAALIEYVFHHALRAVLTPHQQDLGELSAKYEPLGQVLRELHSYCAKRRDRANLIHRKALMQAFACQNDKPAQHLLFTLNLQLESNERLSEQLEEVERRARKCYERGLLFKAVVTFLKGLRRRQLG